MRIFEGLDQRRALLVDNSAINFVNQIDNGVPITSFVGDNDSDHELKSLGKYLVNIARKGDLREHNRMHFKL